MQESGVNAFLDYRSFYQDYFYEVSCVNTSSSSNAQITESDRITQVKVRQDYSHFINKTRR